MQVQTRSTVQTGASNGIRRRYFAFSDYVRQQFGERIQKLTLDGGFTCPNRDGTLSRGGCSFCNNEGFSTNSRGPVRPIREQIEESMRFLGNRYGARRFMAYFQAYTSTYGDLKELRERFEVIREFPQIVGLAVGTRPDCVSPVVLDLLEEFSDQYETWIEYGLQTVHDSTQVAVNRGHGFESFQHAMKLTRGRALKICVHTILGLPGEGRAEMMETIERLEGMGYHALKIHPLHIVRGTPLEKVYRRGAYRPLEFDEYVDLACQALARTEPQVVIQRITAEAPPQLHVAPEWCLQKARVLRAIDDEMEKRDLFQGCLVRKS